MLRCTERDFGYFSTTLFCVSACKLSLSILRTGTVCAAAMAATSSSAVLTLLFLVAQVVLAILGVSYTAHPFVGIASKGPSLRTALVQRSAASAETFSKVADVVADQLGVDKEKVVGEATLSALGADSLDIVETVMALEEAFDVELPDEETTKLKNVQDVADLIQSKSA